ncbi:MAG: S8 family serine peptidase, partial [bacterium]|nr:S8 family serine peptidase [bacterium]
GNPKLGPFRPHISRDIAFNNCGVDELEEKPNPDPAVNRAGHGTHITGVIGASTDNGRGVAGTCWDCSIQMLKISPSKESYVVIGLDKAMAAGAQVVNMSFRMLEEPCAPQTKRFICNAIDKASNRDTLLVAAAGNDLGAIDFPAIDSRVVAVGGLEWISTQSGKPIAQFWSEEPNCPFPDDPSNPKSQCGSNFGPELDLVAPAKTIISTMYQGFDHNPTLSCGDNFLPSSGYGPCTGTSMATPFLVGIAALVRS